LVMYSELSQYWCFYFYYDHIDVMHLILIGLDINFFY
jgi:hypothetical protein